ncbi:MmgE/PrpD family protein, partial [Sutterella wadsworthensis]
MNQPTLLSAIARWIVSADFPDLPDGEIAAARAALADFVAVAAAGSGTPVVRNAALYAAQNERAGACVQQLGRTVRFSPRTAAFLNGTAAHALDFDDVSWTTIGHPTVGIAPTALSLAVAQGLSGREFLTAYVVGAECAHQIARWTMPELSEHGWHTTLANG